MILKQDTRDILVTFFYGLRQMDVLMLADQQELCVSTGFGRPAGSDGW